MKNLIIGLGILLLGIGAGIAVGLKKAQKPVMSSNDKTELLKRTVAAPTEIRGFFGKIKQIKGDTLTLDIEYPSRSLDEMVKEREVVIGPNTEISKKALKDANVFAKEMAEYQVALKKQSLTQSQNPANKFTPIMPPYRLIDLRGEMSDLQIGTRVSIQADENIKYLHRFTATKVTLFPQQYFAPGEAAPPMPMAMPMHSSMPNRPLVVPKLTAPTGSKFKPGVAPAH